MIALAVCVGLSAGLGGCGGAAATPAAAPSVKVSRPVASGPCPNFADGGTNVYFGPHGTDLAGIVYGTGTVGIVFAHEFEDDACDWAQYARSLAAKGYRTLAFDFNGYGASVRDGESYDADVTAAAAYLRSRGATSIVLVGASMGGTAVLTAAATLTPPAVGVIALSAPAAFAGMNVLTGASDIHVPVLVAAGTFDVPFDQDARDIGASLTGSSHVKVVVVDSGLHGHLLIVNQVPEVVTAVNAFLSAYAPPA
jgi:pimeloyl-ACP methyl ester carboxylesterase